MKILVLFFLIFTNVYSQDFTGKWKIISLEDKIVYVNKLTDSIYIKDLKNKTTVEEFRKMSQQFIYPTTFIFGENGDFESYNPLEGTSKGNFVVDREKKTLTIIETNGKRNEAIFSFNNGILFLQPIKENGETKIGFIKE
jgi:hypothetical protein